MGIEGLVFNDFLFKRFQYNFSFRLLPVSSPLRVSKPILRVGEKTDAEAKYFVIIIVFYLAKLSREKRRGSKINKNTAEYIQ